MEAVYLLRAGTVADVRAALSTPPSYSAVRTTMGILVRKGFLATRPKGRRYLYRPVVSHEKARRNAARHLLETYFDGSVPEAVRGLIDSKGLDTEDFQDLVAMMQRKTPRGGRK